MYLHGLLYIENLQIANRIEQSNVGSAALIFELFDKVNIIYKYITYAGPSSCEVLGVGLRPLAS